MAQTGMGGTRNGESYPRDCHGSEGTPVGYPGVVRARSLYIRSPIRIYPFDTQISGLRLMRVIITYKAWISVFAECEERVN